MTPITMADANKVCRSGLGAGVGDVGPGCKGASNLQFPCALQQTTSYLGSEISHQIYGLSRPRQERRLATCSCSVSYREIISVTPESWIALPHLAISAR
jgi:hypothetical protein